MTLSRFTEIWASASYPSEPVSEAELLNVEMRLNFSLPSDYKRAILEVGLPRPTIALLDAIVERNIELHTLGDFYSPTEIIEETIGWREIGMPETLVAFASDGIGNKFCFTANSVEDGAENIGVWFYDHDFDTVTQIACSFDGWIEAFCQVEPWHEPDVKYCPQWGVS